MNKTLRIATRKSHLALWQAQHVAECLTEKFPFLKIELVPVLTEGDLTLDQSLSKIGGKGLFVKALEQKLLSNEADLAVHSLKDMPATLPSSLILGAVGPRANPEDALLSTAGWHWSELPQNAIIGTSSLRRAVQLKALRSDCQIQPLRGNVPTRIEKLKAGQFDAIILAKAGLDRLKIDTPLSIFSTLDMLPAVGQGAIGIECRENDTEVLSYIQQAFHDKTTATCIAAERALNATLQGSCQVPLAAFAEIQGNVLQLEARIGCLNGKEFLSSKLTGSQDDPQTLGSLVAKALLSQGAGDILEFIREHGFFPENE